MFLLVGLWPGLFPYASAALWLPFGYVWLLCAICVTCPLSPWFCRWLPCSFRFLLQYANGLRSWSDEGFPGWTGFFVGPGFNWRGVFMGCRGILSNNVVCCLCPIMIGSLPWYPMYICTISFHLFKLRLNHSGLSDICSLIPLGLLLYSKCPCVWLGLGCGFIRLSALHLRVAGCCIWPLFFALGGCYRFSMPLPFYSLSLRLF